MMTTHFLDLLVEGYAGNFEIELASYVFGRCDYTQEDRDFTSHLTTDEVEDYDALIGEDFLEGFDSEYGFAYGELNTITHPVLGTAHNSVRVHISDASWRHTMTEDRARLVVAMIEERSRKFFTLYSQVEGLAPAHAPSFLGLVHTQAVTTYDVEAL